MAAWILSPVFIYECVVAARRWQTYAVRTAFLGALLVSLVIVWVLRVADHHGGLSRNALGAIGEAFFVTIAGTQLVLMLLAAPAYTAGSICLDKARGTLAHMLVTDLSAAEIVVGKLGAHGLPVLGLLLAGLPVLVLATLLGGIEPEAVLGSFFVCLGVALVSCSVALVLSVWGNKPYEVMLATYLVLVVWLLALPVWLGLQRPWGLGITPDWLKLSNPFALLFAPYLWPGGLPFRAFAEFVAGSVGVSMLLIVLAILSLRPAFRREPIRRPRKRHWRWPRLLRFGPGLDFNPVLWREWHRRVPSRWLRVIWGVYALVSIVASLIALSVANRRTGELAAFVNAFQFSIGLLLVSITSVASLFEERVNGSLDVLLTTPLSTAQIVWGKWLASFRVVALVGILPALLAIGVFVTSPRVEASVQVLVMIALLFAYGALVNSLGLALATWVQRFGVAIGLTVTAYILLAAGPVLLLLAVGPVSEDMRGFACLSPWYGVGLTTAELDRHGPGAVESILWKFFWLFSYAAVALVLAWATLRTFDRCIGRARSRP